MFLDEDELKRDPKKGMGMEELKVTRLRGVNVRWVAGIVLAVALLRL